MGAIQNSLNQIFASGLGAAFALSQHPSLKAASEKKRTLQSLRKQQETLERAENVGPLPTTQLHEYKAKRLDLAKQAFEIDPSEETLTNLEKTRRDQPTETPAYEGYDDYYGSEDYQGEIAEEASKRTYEQRREEDVQRLVKGLEAKQGVQNAVPERKALLDELRAQGVNVDNPALIKRNPELLGG